MINILDNGKYRPRNEWSTNSIPSLVNIEEQNCSDEENENHLAPPSVSPLASSPSNGLPPKSPRRGSFGGLFGGRSSNDKGTKRRSSIAVSFLGRRESNKITKEQSSSYESAVQTEKSDASTGSPEIIFTSHSDDVHTTTVLHENNSKSGIRYGFFENNSNSQNIIDKNDSVQMEKESTKNRGRMRRMSWQTKLERRKKKTNYDLAPPQQLSPDDARRNSFDSKRKNSNGDIPYKTDEETGEDGEENDNGGSYYGGGGDDDISYRSRQKRHSWWNIFVPDHIKNRSRRASQDVTFMTRSEDCLAPPTRRSKSRSVDHGLATPFDLDSLRSKVEGRFESVDRLTKDADKLKKSSLPAIPTKTYTVRNCDTLTSVAAHFDTTPSELTHLNRLNSNFIYPGQQLLVPDKTNLNKDDSSSTTGSTGDGGCCGANESSISGKSSPIERKLSGEVSSDEKDILDGLRPGSPKPGHIERVQTKSDDQIITQRFLKINVRHITDGQGVVAGVLLVTPNAVMFDPNVSDPLVIEHGPESYGVIAPMELVVNAAIFNDIAHMRVAGSNASNSICQEKVEIYYPKSIKEDEEDDEDEDKNDDQHKDGGNRLEGTQSPGKDSLLVKDETFPELGGSVETCDDQESIASSGREGDAFPKAFDRDRVTPVSGEIKNDETKDSTKTEDGSETNDKSGADTRNTIDDRRKSLLDHHWAIPNKDRASISNSRRSSEDDGDPNENNTNTSALIAAAAAATKASIDQTTGGWRSSIFAAFEESASNSRSNSIGGNSSNGRRRSSLNSTTMSAAYLVATAAGLQPPLEYDDGDRTSQQSDEYVKSYYDSGIDIRDPIPIVPQIPTKKVYSDADIVLSNDWVPPRTISPVLFGSDTSPSKSGSISGPSSSGIGPSIISQTQSLDANAGGAQRKKTSSVSFSVDENNEQQQQQPQQQQQQTTTEKANEKKNKMLKRLSYPLTWVEGLTGDNTNKGSDSTESAPNTGDSNQSVFSKVFSSSPITLVSELGGNLFSKTPSEDSGGSPVPPVTPHSADSGRSSIGTFMRTQSSSDGTGNSTSKQKSNTQSQPKLDYRSMVSIDDMPELFVSFDKLIPRPARACQDPPLYLRLRMGKPIGKAIPLPTSVMSYGKNKLRPEYWFSVPKNRTDELYRFINTWVPHLYGELNEEQIKERGFELIQHDTEWTKNGSPTKINRTGSSGDGVGEELTELTRESWELIKAPYVKVYNIIKTAGSHDLDFLGGEVLSMSTDDYRKASLFATGSFDLDFPIPELIGETEILTEEHREKLCGHLPARAEGYSWTLVFSTSQHGFSLNSLYRKMQRLESPVLICIEDTDHNVFGALTSCSLHVSDHFYGTGESLLYKFNPNFKVFHWTGENLYFIKGNPESLSIGAGDGRFGLWLDGDLNQGRSSSCSTYGNEPLAPQEDFVIKTLECWAFV